MCEPATAIQDQPTNGTGHSSQATTTTSAVDIGESLCEAKARDLDDVDGAHLCDTEIDSIHCVQDNASEDFNAPSIFTGSSGVVAVSREAAANEDARPKALATRTVPHRLTGFSSAILRSARSKNVICKPANADRRSGIGASGRPIRPTRLCIEGRTYAKPSRALNTDLVGLTEEDGEDGAEEHAEVSEKVHDSLIVRDDGTVHEIGSTVDSASRVSTIFVTSPSGTELQVQGFGTATRRPLPDDNVSGQLALATSGAPRLLDAHCITYLESSVNAQNCDTSPGGLSDSTSTSGSPSEAIGAGGNVPASMTSGESLSSCRCRAGDRPSVCPTRFVSEGRIKARPYQKFKPTLDGLSEVENHESIESEGLVGGSGPVPVFSYSQGCAKKVAVYKGDRTKGTLTEDRCTNTAFSHSNRVRSKQLMPFVRVTEETQATSVSSEGSVEAIMTTDHRPRVRIDAVEVVGASPRGKVTASPANKFKMGTASSNAPSPVCDIQRPRNVRSKKSALKTIAASRLLNQAAASDESSIHSTRLTVAGATLAKPSQMFVPSLSCLAEEGIDDDAASSAVEEGGTRSTLKRASGVEHYGTQQLVEDASLETATALKSSTMARNGDGSSGRSGRAGYVSESLCAPRADEPAASNGHLMGTPLEEERSRTDSLDRASMSYVGVGLYADEAGGVVGRSNGEEDNMENDKVMGLFAGGDCACERSSLDYDGLDRSMTRKYDKMETYASETAGDSLASFVEKARRLMSPSKVSGTLGGSQRSSAIRPRFRLCLRRPGQYMSPYRSRFRQAGLSRGLSWIR
ncbi:hypothetical protein WOLCODRAFT_165043 [Wolfiporia cocos MD-104 SS10]|uniref:Uncharacterized protein n=1 Tax=Wolfiporia cocos (strain MD-104) TaxID=742152 RepID=A0A2H3JQ52_WOLCO|nr:hypothetical protein WOLCODRAFT_165043 [Wolfiporia cocos MD-104 SS10]